MNTASNTTSLGTIGCAPLALCGVRARRERLRLAGTLNGIEDVEVGVDGVSLCVHLFGEIPPGIGVANVRISGGDRITGLNVLSVHIEDEPNLHDDACLRVVLDREGDHTAYCLCLVDANVPPQTSDSQLIDFLRRSDRPLLVVATKADRVGNRLQASLNALKRAHGVDLVLPYSSKSGLGQSGLWKRLRVATAPGDSGDPA